MMRIPYTTQLPGPMPIESYIRRIKLDRRIKERSIAYCSTQDYHKNGYNETSYTEQETD